MRELVTWLCFVTTTACVADRADDPADAASARDAGALVAMELDAGFRFPDAATPQPTPDAALPAMDACSGIDLTDGAALHQAALEVLAGPSPCGFGSCHASAAKGALELLGKTDLRALLVDRAACEAPRFSLVASGGGGAALERSWLWLKVASGAPMDGAFPASADYGTPGACGQAGSEPYGRTMPLASPALSESRLAALRAWICAGAPGRAAP